MPEVVDEYLQILISKNTYERLSVLSELVPVTTATNDAVIGAMLIDLDSLTEGDRVLYFEGNSFKILDIGKFIQKHKPKPKSKKAVKEE